MAFVIDFLKSTDKDSIVTELRRIAALLGKRGITIKEIDQHGQIGSATVRRKFGTLRKAHEAAGMVALRYTKATNEELLKVVADLWSLTLRKSGRRPRQAEVEKYGCPVSHRTIVERFGGWKEALIATAKAYSTNPPPTPPAKPLPCAIAQRKPISRNRRFFVMNRDGFTCCFCHKAGRELEVERIVPVNRGGTNKVDNLQTLCKPCCRGKSKRVR